MFNKKPDHEISFTISRKVVEIFQFVLSQTNDKKEELLINWRKETPYIQNTVCNEYENKASVVFYLDETQKNAFTYFFEDRITGNKDCWLENHIRKYCYQNLIKIDL